MTVFNHNQEKNNAYYTWRTKYLRPYLNGMFVAKHRESRHDEQQFTSQAHGLGMLAAVTIGRRADFDGLLKYFRRFKNKLGLMGAYQNMDKKRGTFNPACSCCTEADVDIATSLFIAKNKWGCGGYNGEIDHGTEATRLARSIWEHSFNHETYMPLGDDSYNLVTPSHFILNGYWILQQEDTERSEQWAHVMDRINAVIHTQLALNPNTGLLADCLRLGDDGAYAPAQGQVFNRRHGEYYGWESCKSPWSVAYYYIMTGDERLKELLETQAEFFVGKLSTEGISADFTLDERKTSDCYQKAVTAPVRFLVGTLSWDDRYNQMKDTVDEAEEGNNYFGDAVVLLCTLQFHGTWNTGN